MVMMILLIFFFSPTLSFPNLPPPPTLSFPNTPPLPPSPSLYTHRRGIVFERGCRGTRYACCGYHRSISCRQTRRKRCRPWMSNCGVEDWRYEIGVHGNRFETKQNKTLTSLDTFFSYIVNIHGVIISHI